MSITVYDREITFGEGINFMIVFERGDCLGFRSEKRAAQSSHKYRGFQHKIVDRDGAEYAVYKGGLVRIPQ